MDEFIQVFFPSRRRVLVDGRPSGFTDDVLVVSRGGHRITLGPPANFVPSFRRAVASGTSAKDPLLIAFSPRPHPGAPPRPLKAAKKARKASKA